jgi:hypothetical protein
MPASSRTTVAEPRSSRDATPIRRRHGRRRVAGFQLMNPLASARATFDESRPRRDDSLRVRPPQPAHSPPAAAQILALQRGAGNHAVSRMIAGPILQRALKTVRSTQGTWKITGRPAFSSATTSAMPVDSGDHRAHTTAWETIRSNVQDFLNSDGGDDHVYEIAVVNLLQPLAPMGGYDTTTAFAQLRKIRDTKSDDTASVSAILTQLNGLLDNLDEGHGSTNSTIQGHYDPKVVSTGTGFDLRPSDRDTIMATAHVVKPLLLDETGKFILASTFNLGATRGRIPVDKAEGTLREMIDGMWYDTRKPRKRAAPKTTTTAKKAKGKAAAKATGKGGKAATLTATAGIKKPRTGRKTTPRAPAKRKVRR